MHAVNLLAVSAPRTTCTSVLNVDMHTNVAYVSSCTLEQSCAYIFGSFLVQVRLRQKYYTSQMNCVLE